MTVNVTIMGSGGIGGVIGGRLAASGADVLFLARGAHLEALQTRGLKLTSALGDLSLPSVRALASGYGQPPADFVIFTVKGPETVAAAELIAPVVGPNTSIITFQNGVEGVDILQARFGNNAVLPGVTYIGAVIEAPGHIRQIGVVNRSLFGETDGSESTRGHTFRDMANSAGLDMQFVDNISEELWGKFAMLGPFSSIACLSRLPVGTWARTPETLELFLEGMREVIALARMKGVNLDESRLIPRSTEFVKKLEPTWKGSMLTDLERGKAIEVGSLAGYVHRTGKALGVATPFHSTAYRALCYHAGHNLMPSNSPQS
jgi:2-dehydropantoate 2-reductase